MTGDRNTIDVGALMETCLAQQEIIKTYGIIVERLCESAFLDAETEAGFWQYLTAKQSRKSGLEKKVDGLMCGTYDAAIGIYGD